MKTALELSGTGHAIGSRIIRNADVATSLGLPQDWFQRRTGIVERRATDAHETVVTLAGEAVTTALKEARLGPDDIGHETVLLHIQNGPTHLTPSAGAVLSGHLGLKRVRVLGIDGACAEPVAALEIAETLLAMGRCRRVILSAAADFLWAVDPNDLGTAGLFGAGAGAAILSAESTQGTPLAIRAIHWETHSDQWQLGVAPIHAKHPEDSAVRLEVGYYTMQGMALARFGKSTVPGVIRATMKEAGWQPQDVDLVLAHQPNVRLLTMVSRELGFPASAVPTPVSHLGNMGPASLLVNLSLARHEGRMPPGTKALLTTFGVGFACGAAAIET
ncbi:3-oxoacyl-ACP synthase III family protein [Streptomyces sp. NPDC059679]|uniref:3-oxoacyl-ACP synthase III family protein n=1 Tax=Streptomyces sp. NPDC059679 TaxID=3346903 RepID=UPI0036B6B6E8